MGTYGQQTARNDHRRMPTNSRPLELRDYLATLWLRKWWIVTVAAVSLAAALFSSLSKTPLYTSSAEVLVLPVSVPGVAGTSSGSFVDIETEIRIATSAAVSQLAQASVAGGGDAIGSISVSNPDSTSTLFFTSVSKNPRVAQATAQAYAEAYLTFRRDGLLSSVDASVGSIDQVIATLNNRLLVLRQRLATSTNPSQQQVLQLKISSITGQISVQQSSRNELALAQNARVGEVLAPAYLPSGPSSPNPRKDGALGLIVGLALGVGFAFLRDRLDQRLRGREDIERSVDAPLVAMVPSSQTLHRQLAVTKGGDRRAGEAYRMLRTKVFFSASNEPVKSLMITSAEAGEGKTTTAANLAMALAQADHRVVLVSADLRRPDLQRYFANLTGRGLSDLLAGDADLADVIMTGPLDNLYLISSGSPIREEPDFGSEEMTKLIHRLGESADFIVFDGTPVLGVSDALGLASVVDKVILVTDATRSTRGAVEEASGDLRSVGASILGVVLTRFNPQRFHPDYGYHRRGYYDGEPEGYGEVEPTRLGGRRGRG
jgi:capsular exopolysaccharide synthesis family protein